MEGINIDGNTLYRRLEKIYKVWKTEVIIKFYKKLVKIC
jgi:hypothetical protein